MRVPPRVAPGGRGRTPRLITGTSEATCPTRFGTLRVKAYCFSFEAEHAVLRPAEAVQGKVPYVFIHPECRLGDVLGSQACGCRACLDAAMSVIASEGSGLIIYLHRRTAEGLDHAPITLTEWVATAQILDDLQVPEFVILEGQPQDYSELLSRGFDLAGRRPLLPNGGQSTAQALAAG